MRKFLLILAIPAFVATGAIAQTTTADHGSHSSGDHAGMTEGVHAMVKVNGISDDSVNVSHGPIPEIGWPAMTMDLKLLEGAEIGSVGAGDDAMMVLEKGSDGLYGIRALMPTE